MCAVGAFMSLLGQTVTFLVTSDIDDTSDRICCLLKYNSFSDVQLSHL